MSRRFRSTAFVGIILLCVTFVVFHLFRLLVANKSQPEEVSEVQNGRLAAALTRKMDIAFRRDDAQEFVDRTRQAASAEEWQKWAAQVIDRAKTNSTPLPSTEWPEFVRRTGTSWQVIVGHSGEDTNSSTLVMLVQLGGFESIGIIIGPPSYVDLSDPHHSRTSKEVYQGIYVRTVH